MTSLSSGIDHRPSPSAVGAGRRRRLGALIAMLIAMLVAALLLAGCGSQVTGSPGTAGPTPGPTGSQGSGPSTGSSTAPSAPPTAGDDVPLAWQKTFTSTHFLKLSSVRVDGSRRAAFLKQLTDEDLREEMTEALESAPPGTALYAGALDSNCKPSMTPRLRVQEGTVVLDTAQKSEYDGECYVAYTSYAIVAVDPGALPPSGSPTPTR